MAVTRGFRAPTPPPPAAKRKRKRAKPAPKVPGNYPSLTKKTR